MATFVQDSFTLGGGETTGENLSAHIGEVGAHWTQINGGAGNLVLTAAGRVAIGGTTAQTYWLPEYGASGVPGSADYSVQADLTMLSVPAGVYQIGLKGREGAAGANAYQFGYDSTQGWYLKSPSATLGSSAHTMTVGETHTIALHMSGSSIWGTVDGTTVVGPFTDTSVTSAGAAGFFMYVDNAVTAFVASDTAGPQLDNVLCQDSTIAYTVTVSPATVTLAPLATQQFAATVSNTANQSVTWSVVESGGGTISAGGLYTAPAAPGTYHVKATAAVDGVTSGQATAAVVTPTTPTAPHITIATASGLDTISVSAAVAPGTNPVAGYRLYESATSGAETDTGVTITPSTFPAAFPAQPTAAAGAAKYYVARAYDTATPTPNVSAASNEVYSRTTGLIPSGHVLNRVFAAPYGASSSGLAATLGYTVYDYAGAVLQQHTTGQTYEVATGSGIYTALVGIDSNYVGVLVWDAPSGGGPYVEAFDAGPLAQVSGYGAGLDPASMVLQTPANKLHTTSTGQVQSDMAQAVPTSNTAHTLGDALCAARAVGFGKWVLSGTTLSLYAPDGTTAVRTFTLDSPIAPTQRT